jgi:nicotinamidase/pyrazinamidase
MNTAGSRAPKPAHDVAAGPRALRPPGPGDALVVVDLQRDFLPGGALGVPHGDAVVAPLNRLLKAFESRGLPSIATRDWHPPDHCSFKAQGGPWPPHCVAGSQGALFAQALALPGGAQVVSKATTSQHDAYSGFAGTALHALLQRFGVGRLFVGGLATDYCVLHTVLDARALGYEVIVLRDAVAAVNAQVDDGARALARMQAAGARLVDSTSLA